MYDHILFLFLRLAEYTGLAGLVNVLMGSLPPGGTRLLGDEVGVDGGIADGDAGEGVDINGVGTIEHGEDLFCRYFAGNEALEYVVELVDEGRVVGTQLSDIVAAVEEDGGCVAVELLHAVGVVDAERVRLVGLTHESGKGVYLTAVDGREGTVRIGIGGVEIVVAIAHFAELRRG